VDLASRVMLGAKLAELGYGTGLYRTPPYCAVKVPVFSFEKLSDANSILGPEMKSTGEVLGIGKTTAEALYKGLTAAGFKVPGKGRQAGVLLSVEENDYQEVLGLAKQFFDLGIALYATGGTAEAIGSLGIPVTAVPNASENNAIIKLMESGALNYVIYTGAVKDATMGDFIALHRRAMQLGIPCLTSPDTAKALADIIASGFNLENTELVDINAMRPWQQTVRFAKMHSCGNDYIFIENFDEAITCPESLCVSLCDRHYGIGADGIVLIERSRVADAKMRSYNRDGSEGKMAGNNIRCVGKYLYDKGYVRSECVSIETMSGVHALRLFLRDGKVSSVSVDMGRARCEEKALTVDGKAYDTVCVDVGNPHCVVFCDGIDGLDLAAVGPKFEHHEAFPDRTNTEFVRVVNPTTLRLRVWERGSGETLACGTGACAAVAAAVERGLCAAGTDVTVKLLGGDLTVNCTPEKLTLTGSAVLVFEGTFAY
jgi:carbamoyl-phosphate synthase large subunit